MVSENNELKSEHFYKFVDMFKVWQKYFGLHGWEVRYAFIDDPASDARASMTVFDLGNHLAGITIYTNWDLPPDDQLLWRTAFHECIELLLAEMNCLAEQRRWNYNEYDRVGHSVIRTLETVVFDKMWGDQDELFNIFQSTGKAKKRTRRKVSKANNK